MDFYLYTKPMISRKNRFHGRASIRRLYTSGKSVRTGSLSLRYAPNPMRQEYRLGVVVSRKISKSAVVRNRLRRRLYECVRILSSEFAGTYDLLVTVYDARVAGMPAEDISREVANLLAKAGITSAKPRPHGIVKP